MGSYGVTALRRRILTVASEAGEGHVASAFSILDILWTLRHRIMQWRLDTDDHDRLILSKGHGALALYAILEELDIIPSMVGLPGHPELGTPGIEASTGSLGHGLPVAAGLAYALKLKGSSAQVFCIVGDTEMEEGSCWEAAHMAARLDLGNLMVIVDNNRNSPNQINGGYRPTNLAAKFLAFGWNVGNVDGHDPDDLETMLIPLHARQPHIVIAHTEKGYGVKRMEDDPQAWHRRAPTAAELPEMLAELR